MGKVHGSLARAGKVRSGTPKKEKTPKPKSLTGRARMRQRYLRKKQRESDLGPKRGPNSNVKK